jgi:DNA-binding PadR family transcriptional regulator
MSVKILQGSLNTLELLLFLSDDQFITSGDIRRNFETIKAGTVDAKLRKLRDEGLIEINHQEILRAGDDRYAYKLTKKGSITRNDLLQKTMRILHPEISKIINQKTKVESKEQDKNDLVKEFLEEFTMECTKFVPPEALGELQGIIKSMLNSYL